MTDNKTINVDIGQAMQLLEASPELADTMNKLVGGPALVEATQRADALVAAIQYALDLPSDGLIWLRLWSEGDKEAMAELDDHLASQ